MKIEEAKKLINYLLDNNLNLIEKGQNKIAINIEGSAGIGKTSVLKQIADERGADYIRIELASLEEIGDLVGMPIKEYVMTGQNGEEIWVPEKLLDEYKILGYKICQNCASRMSYSIPSWVPTDPEKEVILNMDDFSRANPMFMQAIMALVQFGEYVSWKLPKKTHLLLTSNEDNGSMNVTSLDSAQQTRMLTFKLGFDYEQYGKWMDNQGMKDVVINFMLMHPEIFDQSDKINARTYTMFANAISGFSKWDDTETLANISLIAKGCFGEDTSIGDLFATFIYNKLDKLLTAKEMLSGKWEETSKKIKDTVTKDGEYRADIAAVLTLRLINYIENMDKSDTKKLDATINRVNDLMTTDEPLLAEDLLFRIIVFLNNKFPTRCTKLLMNPKIRQRIL